jgi:hypothetical protein
VVSAQDRIERERLPEPDERWPHVWWIFQPPDTARSRELARELRW